MIDEETRKIFLDHLEAKTAGCEGDPCPVCGYDDWQLEGSNHVINDKPIVLGSAVVTIGSIPLILTICKNCSYARMFASNPILSGKDGGKDSPVPSPRTCSQKRMLDTSFGWE
jgi:hypothetical protein